MAWLCLCKAINADDAAACATCHAPPILAPIRAGRAGALTAQTFEQFRSDDLERTILPAYKILFEDTAKTTDMRLHVARALVFARALRGYYDAKHATAPADAATADLAIRFAVALHQTGKLWKVKEARVIRLEVSESAEPPPPVSAKPARAWKAASQSWGATYLEALGLAKDKADAIAALIGPTPPADDVNTAIVRDAYLLERMRKEGAFDKAALNSFIKEGEHADALAALVLDAKALIEDTAAGKLDVAWLTKWDKGGSCLHLVEEAVRAKSPDRAAPKFLRLHALREEATADHLGNFLGLIGVAGGSGGTLTAALVAQDEDIKPMVDFASQKLGKTIQCSFFPEAKTFCLGWDSGAVLEKRGAKYFLKSIYVHDKVPSQPVFLLDKSQVAASATKAVIPSAKHKCVAHKGADCKWLVYDMAAKDLEISRLLTVSVSACSVACVWDQGATKILLSHINAAPPIPVGMMAHAEGLAVGSHALRMLGSFYGSASEKKKFTTDLPYKELPFSRVLFSRSLPAFEGLESPPALTHPLTGLDLTGAAPAWIGEYGASGLGGVAGGVKILLGELPEIEPLRKELVYLTQTEGEIASTIKATNKLLKDEPTSPNKAKWTKQVADLTKQKPLVGKILIKLAGEIIMAQKRLEDGDFGFGDLWKYLFAAIKAKDAEAPLIANDVTEVGGCMNTYLAHRLPENDNGRKRAAMLLFLYLQTGKPIVLNDALLSAFMRQYTKFKIPLSDVAFGKLVAAVPKMA